MLLLNRKPGETILIGEGVRVTVVRIDRGRVELGVEAPKAVPIVRAELLNRAIAKELKNGTT